MMPDWSQLEHAYGSAEDLPEILAACARDPASSMWADLWSRVCHQGTTYSASPHVLPFLLEMATGWTPSRRVEPLFLAGCIVAAPDSFADDSEDVVGDLKELALETLNSRELNSTDRVHAMQAALSLGGETFWGEQLDGLNDGEFQGTCPACGARS